MQPKQPVSHGTSYQPPSAPPVSSAAPVISPLPNQNIRVPVVRYTSPMRVGKLHSLRVSLDGGDALSTKTQAKSSVLNSPIVVQLSVPGAVVTPPQVFLPVSGGEAQFVVQPLTSGNLSGAKVEFLTQGERLSELVLPMKANRGYLVKSLLILALLLPFIIHLFPDLNYASKITPKFDPKAALLKEEEASKKGVAPESPLGKDAGPGKTEKKTPEGNKDNGKEKEKTTPAEKKTPQLSWLFEENILDEHLSLVALATLTMNPDVKGTGSAGSTNGKNSTEGRSGLNYTGEDVIWAWTRGKLENEGYTTKLVPYSAKPSVDPMFVFDRKYEVTNAPATFWSVGRVVTNILYYCEPVLRFLYRFIIVLPLSFPFGETLYSLLLLGLTGLIWMYTRPQGKKIKGPAMDIRPAHA